MVELSVGEGEGFSPSDCGVELSIIGFVHPMKKRKFVRSESGVSMLTPVIRRRRNKLRPSSVCKREAPLDSTSSQAPLL
jgi:hypothetical protein